MFLRFLKIACLGALISVAQISANNVPWLHVDGLWLKDEAGNKVRLRGIAIEDPRDMFVGWNCGKDYKYIIDQVVAPYLHCNVVRVPIHPERYDEPMAPDDVAGSLTTLDQKRQYFVEHRLMPVVDYLISKGIYVIIDWHPISNWQGEWPARTNEFWERVAPVYADVPNVLYEIFNEPIGPNRSRENWLLWRQTAQQWVNTIRKHAPRNIILVNSPHWSHDTQFAVNDPFEGTNLVYALHFYPYYNMKQVHNDFFEKNFIYPAKNLPLMVTEWGWQNTPGTVGDEVLLNNGETWYADSMKTIFETYPHVGWTAWSFSAKYYPWTVECDYETYTKGPTYQGEWIRNYLEEIKDVYQPSMVPVSTAPKPPSFTPAPGAFPGTAPDDHYLLDGRRITKNKSKKTLQKGASNIIIQKAPSRNGTSSIKITPLQRSESQ